MYKTPKYLSFIREGCFTLHLVTQSSAREEKKKRQRVESTTHLPADSSKSWALPESTTFLGSCFVVTQLDHVAPP